jgi:hypothetical protein
MQNSEGKNEQAETGQANKRDCLGWFARMGLLGKNCQYKAIRTRKRGQLGQDSQRRQAE